MRINNKCKIATIAMIRLAKAGTEGRVSLDIIAGCQGQSLSYMEQIFAMLKKAGLVDSARGAKGGYKVVSLETSVSDIVKAITGEPDTPDKVNGSGLKVWADISQRTHAGLKNITLADLIL